MRTSRNKDSTYAVWMRRDEYEAIPRAAGTFAWEIAFRLMGECGLRVGEVPDVTPRHISRTRDGEHFMLEVVSGKDTTGDYTDGQQRETWLPRDFEATINRYVQERALADDDPLVQRAPRTIQHWLSQTVADVADATGDDDYRRVSTHDLRRCWAHYLLVEESISPRIVMALGGWSSYDAIEPYLAAPTEANIIDSMSEAEL